MWVVCGGCGWCAGDVGGVRGMWVVCGGCGWCAGDVGGVRRCVFAEVRASNLKN